LTAHAAELLATLPVLIAGTVPRGSAPGQLDLDKWGERGRLAPFVAFALCAAAEALQDARLPLSDPAMRSRTGVALGSGMGHVAELGLVGALLAAGQPRRVSPFFVPRVLVNMAAGQVSMAHRLTGPLTAPATACASGAHALGDALRLIRHGEADCMVAGGTESCVDGVALSGFARAKALAACPAEGPASACRPFDAARGGFVLAEGAGVLVLEELEHARARGAHVYCELRGCGLAADAFHVTQPPGDGRGAAQAMRAALAQAGLQPADVGHVNAHATGTQLGDAAEAAAVARLFDGAPRDHPLLLSSTKGSTGHLLGAAGAVEAVFTVLALQARTVPHTLNLDVADVLPKGSALRLVRGAPERAPRLRAALSNSFGFGGTNASLCFASLEEE